MDEENKPGQEDSPVATDDASNSNFNRIRGEAFRRARAIQRMNAAKRRAENERTLDPHNQNRPN